MNTKHYKILGYLQIFIGMGAVSGGLPMMSNPDGSSQGLSIELLNNSPFSDYLIPGILLFSVIGIGNLASAYFSLKFKKEAGILGILMGIALMIWIVVQLRIMGMASWFQPAFLAFGTLELVLGGLIYRKHKA